MVTSQEQLLEEGERLDKLRYSYYEDEAVDESYVVLTIGASLIATLGLLANNADIVIGAMVVAPWILPLRALVFGSLIGDKKLLLLLRALLTLASGVAITTLLSMGLGLMACNMDLLLVFPEEITVRLQPIFWISALP